MGHDKFLHFMAGLAIGAISIVVWPWLLLLAALVPLMWEVYWGWNEDSGADILFTVFGMLIGVMIGATALSAL